MSPRRAELLKWFKENALPLADAYEGAIMMLEQKTFPGRIHFISHAVRDIADRLAFVLDPQLEGSRVPYENALDQIGPLWPHIDSTQTQSDQTPGASDHVKIEYRLALIINAIVEKHRERRKRPSNSELLFRYLMRREASVSDVNRGLVQNFKNTREWFMKLTHLRDNAAPVVDEQELLAKFEAFEGMLHSFVGNFFTGTKELDEILRKTNG